MLAFIVEYTLWHLCPVKNLVRSLHLVIKRTLLSKETYKRWTSQQFLIQGPKTLALFSSLYAACKTSSILDQENQLLYCAGFYF